MNKKLTVVITTILFAGFSPLTMAEQAEVSVVEKIVEVQHDLFDGPRQGLRSNHTKGTVVNGSFTPAEEAKMVSMASHLQDGATPVTVRFSNSTGFPDIADNNPKALVKGMAIRFDLGDESYHDLVLSSVPRFPVATPEKFLALLTAIRDSANSEASHKPIETFLGEHPAAKEFVSYPKPYPKSFASLSYHGINAFEFTNANGESVYGRYIVSPAIDEPHLSEAEGKQQDADYLMKELPDRLESSAVVMRLSLQIADADDIVNDATVIWPDDRQVVELGVLRLTAMHEDVAAYEKATMFN
ncbi:MAG: catalase, partial [Methylophaga sp.]